MKSTRYQLFAGLLQNILSNVSINSHMKKNLSVLFSMIAVAIGLSFTGSAQTTTYQKSCNAIPHPLFDPAPIGKTPVVLNRLGTSPQFGEIKEHTARAAYSHLKGVYSRNSARNKREIDNLLQAIGYTGMNDPSFTMASITPETLPMGTTGWMGAYSKGHKYAWSVLGRDFQTFKLSSIDGKCHVYIMRKCGNGFYEPVPPVVIPERVCVEQAISFSGNSKIEKTNFVNATAPVQLVVTNGTNPQLCIGTAQVPVAAQYGISANGSFSYSQTVEICSEDANFVPAPINLISPVQLTVDVKESNVMLGSNGVLMMPVDEAQYKQMSKLYSTCAANTTVDVPVYTREEMSNDMSDQSMATSSSANGVDCKVQTLTFMGNSAVSDGAVKKASNQITVIGTHMKSGKLAKGESADKYLCLGTYPMDASIASAFDVSGSSKAIKSLEICDKDGTAPDDLNVNVPIQLGFDVSNPTMTIGDGERIFINLDDNQYKVLSKRYGRCCGVPTGDCI